MSSEERPAGSLWGSYVSGEMPSGRRDALLSSLRNLSEGTRGLLSNARCLAEGVDVPAIDGVAFIDPKGSLTDIMQAVGPAIRKSPEKKAGVIVLPVFVTNADDPEQALEESSFKKVWEVLKALRAHDEVLGEELDSIRRRIGRVQAIDWQVPSKVVLDLPTSVGADFVRAFDVRLVTAATASWEFWVGLMERYVMRQGHARVPVEYVEDGVNLGSWVATQRRLRASGKLEADRQRRLESLPEWSWNPLDDKWEDGFARLSRYVERTGGAYIPVRYVEDGFRLRQWVNVQRTRRNTGRLDSDRQRRLESLTGWRWNPLDDKWEEGLTKLRQYVNRVGYAHVPKRHLEAGFKLGEWVEVKRRQHAAGRLDAPREEMLRVLPGWTWDVLDGQWEEGFAKLGQYAIRNGHARVQRHYVEEDGFKLGAWVHTQRTQRINGELAVARCDRLSAVPGWTWGVFNEGWEEAFRRVQQYAERTGAAHVPTRYVDDDGFRLGTWVQTQRQQLARRGRMDPERRRRLEGLPGWIWNPSDQAWEEGFGRLRE